MNKVPNSEVKGEKTDVERKGEKTELHSIAVKNGG